MRLKAAVALCLIGFSIGAAFSPGWATDYSWNENDPVTDGWNMMDLLLARPIGLAAGIIGSAVFVATLPFTIPTRSVDNAAQIFIVRPFSFSFSRPLPDPDM
jgi:hypothetical protein